MTIEFVVSYKATAGWRYVAKTATRCRHCHFTVQRVRLISVNVQMVYIKFSIFYPDSRAAYLETLVHNTTARQDRCHVGRHL